MNVVSRDWAVEIATDDELTVLNSWLRAIDQGRDTRTQTRSTKVRTESSLDGLFDYPWFKDRLFWHQVLPE